MLNIESHVKTLDDAIAELNKNILFSGSVEGNVVDDLSKLVSNLRSLKEELKKEAPIMLGDPNW